jgi:hypothetical protein
VQQLVCMHSCMPALLVPACNENNNKTVSICCSPHCLCAFRTAPGAEFVVGDTTGQVVAGVFFGILLPVALVCMSFYLVVKHLTMVVSGPLLDPFLPLQGSVPPFIGSLIALELTSLPGVACLAPACLQVEIQRSAYFVPDETAVRSKRKHIRQLERIASASGRSHCSDDAHPAATGSTPGLDAAAGNAAGCAAEPAGTSAGVDNAGGSAAELARASVGAASEASRSSGVGSSTAAELLRSAPAASAPVATNSRGAAAGQPASGRWPFKLWPSRPVGAVAAAQQQPATSEEQGGEEAPRKPLRKRLGRWLMRYVVKPVTGWVDLPCALLTCSHAHLLCCFLPHWCLGCACQCLPQAAAAYAFCASLLALPLTLRMCTCRFEPTLQGEWVPPHGYDVSFVARYGVLFETSRGPEVEYR